MKASVRAKAEHDFWGHLSRFSRENEYISTTFEIAQMLSENIALA
ncbi:MAG TPA: hypothetical protein VF800_21080 [Telluria sp.]